MRCNGNIGIPFPTKQGNPPSSRFEEGEHAALVELRREPRGSSHVGTGISGNLLSCRKGVRYPFMFQRERGIPLETLLWKGTSSGVKERISWFFSCCCRKLGVPLELRRGPRGFLYFFSIQVTTEPCNVCSHLLSLTFNMPCLISLLPL